MKKLIYLFSILFFFSILVVVFLPASFPNRLGISKVSWEIMSVVRYYAGKCTLKNPWFLVYPETHFIPDIIWSIAYNLPLLSLLPPWKQILIINMLFIYGTSFLIALILLETNLAFYEIILYALLLTLQPAVFIWSFASFAYYIAGFFLILSVYFFLKELDWLGFLTVALLPMIRHEYTVFLLAPILIMFMNKKIGKGILFYFIPLAYYFILPILLWGDWRRLYFFQGELYLSNFSVAPYFQSIVRIAPFLYYVPLFWIGFVGLFWGNKWRKLLFFFLASLFIFVVPFISRVIYPIFLLSFIGGGILLAKLKSPFRSIILVFLVVLSLGWDIYRNWKPEIGDYLGPYCSCEDTVKWLSKEQDLYDYFLLSPRQYFILWNDKNCLLSRKLIYPYTSPETNKIGLGNLLLSDGNIVDFKMHKEFFTKNIVITTMSRKNFASLPAGIRAENAIPISYVKKDSIYIIRIHP